MMQSKIDRKQAIQQYKERKIPRGVYAVRCLATGRVWVGCSPNLDAAKNGTWFALGLGTSFNRSLQAEWNLHGAGAFSFEILETLNEDVAEMAVGDLLKEKRADWVSRLNAGQLL